MCVCSHSEPYEVRESAQHLQPAPGHRGHRSHAGKIILSAPRSWGWHPVPAEWGTAYSSSLGHRDDGAGVLRWHNCNLESIEIH